MKNGKTMCNSTILLPRLVASMIRERRRRGLSQIDLARRLDLSPSYVCMLERGQRSATLETVEALAKALRVSPLALFRRRP